MHREHRIEEVSQANALGLSDESEKVPIAVKAPRATNFGDFEGRFVVAVEELIAELARRVLVRQLHRLGAEPAHAHDGHKTVRKNAFDGGTGRKLFEASHAALVRGRAGGGNAVA